MRFRLLFVLRRNSSFEDDFNFVDGTVDGIIDGRIANPRVIPAIPRTRLVRRFSCRCKWRNHQTDDSNRVIIFATAEEGRRQRCRRQNALRFSSAGYCIRIRRFQHANSSIEIQSFLRSRRLLVGRSNGNASVNVARRHWNAKSEMERGSWQEQIELSRWATIISSVR